MKVVRLRLTVCLAVASIALACSLAGADRAGAAIWSIQRAPARAGATDSVLTGISCTSPDACVAVGGPDDEPGTMLAETWDGTRWRIQRTPMPAGAIQSFLNGVSCTSTSDCLAVGFVVRPNGAVAALSMRWDGLRWRSEPAPRPAGSILSLLTGVSCTAERACTAVGSRESRTAVWFTLAARWSGARWTVQRTPRIPYSELNGVSCPSARACTAVGLEVGGEVVEHWNGRRWWRDQRVGNASGESELNAISCSAPTACTAGGGLVIPSMITWPLLQTWNGGRWSARPVAAQAPGMVYGMSCTSRTVCTAVGSGPLVEELGSRGWSIEPAPQPEHANLYGVSCTGRTCVAVGSSVDRSDREVPLVESTSDSG